MASDIKLQRTYPYGISQLWEALTTKEALSEWLMETDFQLEKGFKFKFSDKPQGGWRGYMECEVLDFKENEFLEISWLGMPEHDLQTVRFELMGDETKTTLHLFHTPWNGTHSALGGFILKQIITFGWKKMFDKQLEPVLAYSKKNSAKTVPLGLVNKYRAKTAAAAS